MLDIPSISATVIAIGVIVGVVFAVLELRNHEKLMGASYYGTK